MQKKNKSKFSLIKITILCAILVLLSGVGVTAMTTSLTSVKIQLSDGYEMTVLTSKKNVKEILEDNNIIVENDENVMPSVDENITETKTIQITNKSTQEVEIAKISESGIETTIDELMNAYSTITEKIETVEEAIPFETVTKDISEGASSTRNSIIQEGEEGLRRVTYKVKYQNATEIERNKISEEIVKEPVNKIIQVRSNVVSSRSISEARSSGSVSGSVAEYQAYAAEKCESYGWSDSDFSCLVSLWNKESGWNPNSYNRSSGAYGIPQALPGSKMASAGSDYMTNYKTQINWGLSYIKSRYGTPTAAWNHWKARNWY